MCALSQMISEFLAGAGVVRLTSPAVSNNNLALNEWPSNFWHCITVETLYFFFLAFFLSFSSLLLKRLTDRWPAEDTHHTCTITHALQKEINKSVCFISTVFLLFDFEGGSFKKCAFPKIRQ